MNRMKKKGERGTGNGERVNAGSSIPRSPFPVSRSPFRCLLLGIALTAGCEEVSHREIGDEINILLRRDDALVPPATERLVRYRRAAIPQIETAMHTAAPTGR